MSYPYIIHSNFLNVVIKGVPFMMNSTNVNFKKCIEAIKSGSWKQVEKYLNPLKIVEESGVDVRNGQVYYRGEEVHSTLTEKMIALLNEGFDIEPMRKFLENLMQNPSLTSVTELYGFLEKGNLPLTEDGHFLAYKRVRGDYKDIHSNSFDNSVGKILEMVRDEVDWDRNNKCSRGFHFCSFGYLSSFASLDSKTDRVMILKINPKDVVSIPVDYDQTKGRTCRYEVFAEYDRKDKFQVPAFNSSLVITKTYSKPAKAKRKKEPVEKKVTKKTIEKTKTVSKKAVKKALKAPIVKAGPARDSHGRFISKKSM